MFKLRKYLMQFKLQLVIGPIAKVFETAVDIISPFLMAIIVDQGISNNDKKTIFLFGGIIFVINLLSFCFTLVCQKCSSIAQAGISRNIRLDAFKQINTWSHGELDKFSTATLTNRLVHDVSQISLAVGMTIRNVTRAPLLLIGSFIMAAMIDLKLSLVFVVIMPIIIFIVFAIMSKNTPLYSDLKTKLDDVTNVTRDNLDSVRVVRAFNKQDYETHRFIKSNKGFTAVNLKIAQYAALLQPLIITVVYFSIIAILWIGGIQVNVGEITTGNLLAFINYLTSIAASLVVVARLIIIYTRTGASIKRVDEVFKTQNTIESPKRPAKINYEMAKGKIEFKNVKFSYRTAKEVVNGLNLVIEPGQVIGIIGGTGSGKSSIVNLIPRFYDATAGEVLIDDINVKRYDLKVLRSIIGIVPQNPVLFEGTLRENMRWRNPDATDEEIVKALMIAQAYDFVKELPDYFDHKVLRGGTNFSGGQRQRLTIARALIGNPKIIILDDSSSALDFATDASLRKAIAKNLKDSTIILVSQRATTLMNADNIIVVDSGNIVDIGNHEKLLKRCDVYKEIYYSQNPKKEQE